MLIHAYKRKENTPIDTGNAVFEFALNDAGEAVADVENEAAIEVLLAIPEAFKVHESSATATSTDPSAPTSYVLKGATPEADLDLSAMNGDELKTFAKANGVTVHYTWTGDKLDKLRQKLVDTFAAE